MPTGPLREFQGRDTGVPDPAALLQAYLMGTQIKRQREQDEQAAQDRKMEIDVKSHQLKSMKLQESIQKRKAQQDVMDFLGTIPSAKFDKTPAGQPSAGPWKAGLGAGPSLQRPESMTLSGIEELGIPEMQAPVQSFEELMMQKFAEKQQDAEATRKGRMVDVPAPFRQQLGADEIDPQLAGPLVSLLGQGQEDVTNLTHGLPQLGLEAGTKIPNQELDALTSIFGQTSQDTRQKERIAADDRQAAEARAAAAKGKADAGGMEISAAQKDELTVMKTVSKIGAAMVTLGDKTKGGGVGGFGRGTMKQFFAKNMGIGTGDSQTLRNYIGQVAGSIAKLRGGTSFTPNEQKLLESYTPTIDDDWNMIKSKIAGLDTFLKFKEEAMGEVAAMTKGKTAPADPNAGSGAKLYRYQGQEVPFEKLPPAVQHRVRQEGR